MLTKCFCNFIQESPWFYQFLQSKFVDSTPVKIPFVSRVKRSVVQCRTNADPYSLEQMEKDLTAEVCIPFLTSKATFRK